MGRKGACNAEDTVPLWSRCWMKGEQRDEAGLLSFRGSPFTVGTCFSDLLCVLCLLSCAIRALKQFQKSLQSKANSTPLPPFLFKFKKCLLHIVSSANSSELGPW